MLKRQFLWLFKYDLSVFVKFCGVMDRMFDGGLIGPMIWLFPVFRVSKIT